MSKVDLAYLKKLIEEHPKLIQPRPEDLEMYKLATKGLFVDSQDFKNFIKLNQMQGAISFGEELYNTFVKAHDESDTPVSKMIYQKICHGLYADLQRLLKEMEDFATKNAPNGG